MHLFCIAKHYRTNVATQTSASHIIGVWRILVGSQQKHATMVSWKTIGFLNNRKANAGFLLTQVETHLREAWGDFTVVTGEKNAALAAPADVQARLSTCDAVVFAIGD